MLYQVRFLRLGQYKRKEQRVPLISDTCLLFYFIQLICILYFAQFLHFSHTSHHINKIIYVAVNFLTQAFYVFLLFLGMAMCAHKVETKKK